MFEQFIYSAAGAIIAMYVYVIYNAINSWNRKDKQATPIDFTPTTTISVIIPARNEAANIKNCIQSILKQNYPESLINIIVVNDSSSDNTIEKVTSLINSHSCISLIKLDNTDKKGKKAAITAGVNYSQSKLIVTTDADCTYNKNWLRNFAYVYEQQNSKLICGPVFTKPSTNLISEIQRLELYSLSFFSAVHISDKMPVMCSGASMAYPKAVFIELNGFDGNAHIQSGDDVFLLQKINAKYPNNIHYLQSEDSITYTIPTKSFTDFLHQHVRWISKGIASYGYNGKILSFTMLITNCLLSFIFLSLFIYPKFIILFLLFLTAKSIADSILLLKIKKEYKQKTIPISLLLLELLYALFFVIIFILHMKGKYKWKERTVEYGKK